MNGHTTAGTVIRVLLTAALLTMGVAPGIAVAQSATAVPDSVGSADRVQQYSEMMERTYISQEQREAAALAMGMPGPGGVPDYFGTTPN